MTKAKATAIVIVRHELRSLAIAAATEIARDRMQRAGRGRGQRADTLDDIDATAERLAARGMAALSVLADGAGDEAREMAGSTKEKTHADNKRPFQRIHRAH
jgi:hypothetical protein